MAPYSKNTPRRSTPRRNTAALGPIGTPRVISPIARPIARSPIAPPPPIASVPIVPRMSAAAISEQVAQRMRTTKYWARRETMFSRYGDGIQLDEQLWYSVTPEWLAAQQAQSLLTAFGMQRPLTVVDAFAGAGGNVIQFALAGMNVVAVELDPVKLEMARHNVSVYGVQDRVTFVGGDFIMLSNVLKADAVFLGPPWGGPQYTRNHTYDIESNMAPYSASLIYQAAANIADHIVMYLPRHSKREQIHQLAARHGTAVDLVLNRRGKSWPGVTAYYGPHFGRRLQAVPQDLWQQIDGSSSPTLSSSLSSLSSLSSMSLSSGDVGVDAPRPMYAAAAVAPQQQPEQSQQPQQLQQQRAAAEEIALAPVVASAAAAAAAPAAVRYDYVESFTLGLIQGRRRSTTKSDIEALVMQTRVFWADVEETVVIAVPRVHAENAGILVIGPTGTIRYGFNDQRWTVHANMPPIDMGYFGDRYSAALQHGKIYFLIDRNEPALIYDIATDQWSSNRVLRTKQGGFAIAILNEHIYVVGGNAREAVFHVPTNRWLKQQTSWCSRFLAGVAVLDGHLYAVGGLVGQNALATAERFLPRSGRWIPIASMRAARVRPSVAGLAGHLYVVGGRDSAETPLQSMERYEPSTDTWKTMAEMRVGRYGPAVVVYDGELYVIDGKPHERRIEVYSPLTNTWSWFAKPLPSPMNDVCAFVV